MEDIVQIKLLFMAGLLVMSGVVALLAYAVTRWQSRRSAQAGCARSSRVARQTVTNIPVGGTR